MYSVDLVIISKFTSKLLFLSRRPSITGSIPKGQLISKCLFEKIVWTKIPTKNSAHYTCWAESIKFFVGILVQTIFSKRHSEIN